MPLDLSVTGYLVLFPVLVLILTSFTSGKVPSMVISAYTFLMLASVLILSLADLEVYKYWGVRIDNTALRFIGTPREMLASSTWFAIGLMLIALILLLLGLYYPFRRYLSRILQHSAQPRWKGLFVFVLVIPFVFLAIRGGTGIAPVNISRVYFHPKPFPNHAAINVIWNTGHSLLEKKDKPNPFHCMDDSTALHYLNHLYEEDTTRIKLLSIPRPNVIVIILESFTAKLIEPLGGLQGVTPNFNRLTKESIFFTNLFANDSRTDKSIVSILSGYPALGKISIIKFPNKTQKLGIISKEMLKNGYHTSFYYGGNIDFASLRSYLINGNFQEIISASAFGRADQTERWGVPDHLTFQRLMDDCGNSSVPFFKVLLSLSSHEPFDIPVKPRFGNKTVDERISSSAFYTDSCLGDFIEKAKHAAWWKHTLIIMLADHGTIFPGNTIVYYPEKYRIPMIWTGGAIKSDTTISIYFSQADLAKTLLNQLDIEASAYHLSRDIFSAKNNFAFYEYNNGFGMISDSGGYVFDNDLMKVILSHGNVSGFFLQGGKALQQEVYEVFLRN
jgi:phosphoglycerol transferase MdoB-like AlkP superfamily enzyme